MTIRNGADFMETFSKTRNESTAISRPMGTAPQHRASALAAARVKELDPGAKRLTQILFQAAGGDGRHWTFVVSDDQWAISASGKKISSGPARGVCAGVDRFFSLSGAPAEVAAQCVLAGLELGISGAGVDVQV